MKIYHVVLTAQNEKEGVKMGINALAIVAYPNLISLEGPQGSCI